MVSGDLSAANIRQPWIFEVLEAASGAASVVNTTDPDRLKTGVFTEPLFLHTAVIKERHPAALAELTAEWDAPGS